MTRKPQRVTHVWIVEMFDPVRGQWEPTTGCALSRGDTRHDEEWRWRLRDPDDKFRVQKYIRPTQPAKGRAK